MPFDPRSPKKAGKKFKRGPAKKRGVLPLLKRWKYAMKSVG
jgi:hypothetical protein